MDFNKTQKILGNVDIYLIDQILKNRYSSDDYILDAGCGEGRNLKWFYENNYRISGIDTDINSINKVRVLYPKNANNFQVGNLEKLPYKNSEFNHIICSAVLHFAKNEEHFFSMFLELIRVLKPKGTILIRIASNIGLDGNIPSLEEKTTKRAATFFITREYIDRVKNSLNIELIEPVKTTNVEDKRAMTTLVIRKL